MDKALSQFIKNLGMRDLYACQITSQKRIMYMYIADHQSMKNKMHNAHDPYWTQCRLYTMRTGHDTDWARCELGTIRTGHDTDWRRCGLETMRTGRDVNWTQSKCTYPEWTLSKWTRSRI